MNVNFVETHVFTKLDMSLDIYFGCLVDFLGPEFSVWKFWPKIPLTLCTKLKGPVAPKLFNFFSSYFANMILLPKWTKWGGVPKKNTLFILVNHPNGGPMGTDQTISKYQYQCWYLVEKWVKLWSTKNELNYDLPKINFST